MSTFGRILIFFRSCQCWAHHRSFLYAIFCQISGKLRKLPSYFSTILIGRKPKRNGLISIAHILNMIKVSLATLFRVDSSKKVKISVIHHSRRSWITFEREKARTLVARHNQPSGWLACSRRTFGMRCIWIFPVTSAVFTKDCPH